MLERSTSSEGIGGGVAWADASYRPKANRPVLAIYSNRNILRTLRAASSFAAERVLASALLHSMPSTTR